MGNKERVGEKHLLINALETRDIKAYSHSLGLHGGERLLAPLPQTPSSPPEEASPLWTPLYVLPKPPSLNPERVELIGFLAVSLPQFAYEGR